MKEAESEINEQDSPLLDLLRIAIFNISYIRGLFPEKYFKDDEFVSALYVEIKELMPMDAESRGLIDWMEKGVYDPLQRKYLKTLMFCIDGPMIEEYAFSFSYYSQSVMMNINRTGNQKHGGTFNYTADITPSEMRSSACKMVHTLIQLMSTLDKMPDERTIVMKLMYYDGVTPPDYELPFFRGYAEEEAQYVWTKNPLRMEAGNVNSKHLVLTLKVKSVLDPCEDENVDKQDDGKSTTPDSVLYGQPSVSDSMFNEDRAKAFVAGIVAEMEKDQTQALIGKGTSTARLMEKAAQKKKTLVINAFRRCLENYFTMQEFPEGGIEEVAVKAALKGFLAFGTQKDKPENVSNMKAYLAHSSLCAKTRAGWIVCDKLDRWYIRKKKKNADETEQRKLVDAAELAVDQSEEAELS